MPQPPWAPASPSEGCSPAAQLRGPEPSLGGGAATRQGTSEATLHSNTHRFRPVSSFRFSVSGKGSLSRPAHPGGRFFLIVMYFFVQGFVQSAR